MPRCPVTPTCPPAVRPAGGQVLDPHTIASGNPLEDYTWVAALQADPRRAHLGRGPHLPWQGWFLLPEALKHRLTRGPFNPTRARHVDLLTEHGLLEANRLTPAGRAIADVLAVPGPRLTVRAWSTGGRTHALDVLIAGPAAVILATPAPSQPPDPSDPPPESGAPNPPERPDDGRPLSLDLVDVTWTPVALAAWTGTTPAWTFSIAPTTIDHDLLMRRLHAGLTRQPDGRSDGGPVPPPPDADEHLRDVWAQPWWLWQLETSGTAQPFTVLTAGRRGSYRLTAGPRDGTVELIPTPPRAVWAALLHAVDLAITPVARS